MVLGAGPIFLHLAWFACGATTIALLLCRMYGRGFRRRGRRALVVVLGDIGHSPRILNQAVSLTAVVDRVDIVAAVAAPSDVPSSLSRHSQVAVIPLEGPGSRLKIARDRGKVVYLVMAAAVVVLRAIDLARAILRTRIAYSLIVIQNPPCLPTFFVVLLINVLFGTQSKVIIDWHNLAYTIMKTTGAPVPLVKLASACERVLARAVAHGHFCVSATMAKWLELEWGIQAIVLYDMPLRSKMEISLNDQHTLFARIQENESPSQQTWKTIRSPSSVQLNPDRPFIIVSSTSWTPDEDFDLFFESLVLLNARLSARKTRRILVLITGKGPLRETFIHKYRQAKLEWISMETLWLPVEDYSTLLASCDLGISMHASSSGLDLPMKVVDMLGCGLPVCALHYMCIEELLSNSKSGRLFRTATDLADCVEELMYDEVKLQALRLHIRTSYSDKSWSEEWHRVARPLVSKLIG